MNNRNANTSIKGYFYQFDYSIKLILECNKKSDSITIEGIEDIDLESSIDERAIQCKYYSKQIYYHSVIAKSIRNMLSHFISQKKRNVKPIKYILYGNFKDGTNKLESSITIDDLKTNFLTYSIKKQKIFHHNDIGATDKDLSLFLSNLIINIDAQDYEEQFQSIINLLQQQFHCSAFEAEYFYYNNALKSIKNLSINEHSIDRKITKKKFLDQINTKQILFNQWYIHLKGLNSHFKKLRKEYFTSLNISPSNRFFLIEINNDEYSRSDLKQLLLLISGKWSKMSKRDAKNFCPYIFIQNISELELINLKTELINENHLLSDGYEFNGAHFRVQSILKEPNYLNEIKFKFINEIQFLNDIIHESTTTVEIYQFYIKNPYYHNDNESINHVMIQIQELKHIKEII